MSYEIGDLVVLSCGSMRMGVEKVEGEKVHTVWCHEGNIGRDVFPAILLRKWEHREDDSGPRRADRGDRGDSGPRGGGKPYGGDRGDSGPGRGKPYGADRSAKPRGKPGWDGKPREKTHFRKD